MSDQRIVDLLGLITLLLVFIVALLALIAGRLVFG